MKITSLLVSSVNYTNTSPRDIDKIVNEREAISLSLTDSQINREVVNNVLRLEGVNTEMKCDILMSSIKDLATIFAILKQYFEVGRIQKKEYVAFLNNFVRRLQNDKKLVKFDPRKLSSVNY